MQLTQSPYPQLITGRYYGARNMNLVYTVGFYTATADTLICVPLYLTQEVTLTKLGVYISSAGGSPTAKLALYNSNGSRPTTLVAATAEFSPTNATAHEFTISETVGPGLYFMAYHRGGGSTQYLGYSYYSIPEASALDHDPAKTTGTGINCLEYSATYSSGAPSDLSASTPSSLENKTPRLWVRA